MPRQGSQVAPKVPVDPIHAVRAPKVGDVLEVSYASGQSWREHTRLRSRKDVRFAIARVMSPPWETEHYRVVGVVPYGCLSCRKRHPRGVGPVLYADGVTTTAG